MIEKLNILPFAIVIIVGSNRILNFNTRLNYQLYNWMFKCMHSTSILLQYSILKLITIMNPKHFFFSCSWIRFSLVGSTIVRYSWFGTELISFFPLLSANVFHGFLTDQNCIGTQINRPWILTETKCPECIPFNYILLVPVQSFFLIAKNPWFTNSIQFVLIFEIQSA